MPSYMKAPQFKIVTTYGGSNYDFTNDQGISGKIERVENGFDTATLFMANIKSANYKQKMGSGSAVKVSFKDASDVAWIEIFDGISRNPTVAMSTLGPIIHLQCDGAGYGLVETACNEEYGYEGIHGTGLQDIQNIIMDSTYGIVTKYANKILGSAVDTGYSYTADVTNVEAIVGNIQFINFQYKPCMNAINDVCDLLQAIKGTNAGPHWIVDVSNNFLLCTLGASHPDAANNGWYKYYLNSVTSATFEQDKDFTEYQFQELVKEANYIIYQGDWQRPSNCDYFTGAGCNALWGVDAGFSDATDVAVYMINGNSYNVTSGAGAVGSAYYPTGKNLGWDLTKICTPKNIPSLNWYARRDANCNAATLSLWNDATPKYWDFDMFPLLVNANQWYHFSLPVGPYYDRKETSQTQWTAVGGPNWTSINAINIYLGLAASGNFWLDGLHFTGARLTRVAKESAGYSSTNPCKIKTISDRGATDDTLLFGTPGTTDVGTMARFAYAELLRSQTTPIIGRIRTPLIKDLLPGQFLHIHAEKKADGSFQIDKDMRVARLTHEFSKDGFFTTTYLTDDLKNSNPRLASNDPVAVFKMLRPEWQDRQASSIKAGDVNPDVPTIEESY